MSGYTFDPGIIWQNLPNLLGGLLLTLEVSLIGIIGALAIGIVGGAVRTFRLPVLSGIVRAYVEFIRNTPLLVQLFFVYFALPELGVRLSGFTVAWLTLMIHGGSYNVENFRAGFGSTAAGFREGARALGLSGWQAFRHVTFPIGVRTAMPSVTNTCISVLKGSSLMVAIGFPELTDRAVSIVGETFRVYEMFFTIAVIYLLVVWTLSIVMRWAERRMAIPGFGI
ncbi:MAG TPA: amino acid ABC transporter permease [Candidatus Acidoferrales bacterium]|nr:amino acid ABC transporter permease [Candidatus Acidoferrales bacterium]